MSGTASQAGDGTHFRLQEWIHYYKMEFPERFHASMDTRRWGPGERIVF
jgi:NitT/TauT family transport system substrate-binding protein